MEPAEYLAALRKHWVLIGALAALGLVGGYAWSSQIPPTYRATAGVYVTVPQTASVGELVQGSNYAQARIESYAQLATKPYVLEPVAEQLGVSSRALAGSVSAAAPLNTVILEISAVDGDPERAAAIANAVSEQLSAAVAELENPGTEAAPHVDLTLVARATPPRHPIAPNTRLNAATALGVGLLLGVGLALARSVLDTRVRTVRDVRRATSTPVLASVQRDRRSRRDPVVVQRDPFGHQAEAYRRLRTNLRFLAFSGAGRSLVVTSSLPGEGKTTTAVNLAIAMAEADARVLLIDADLRRPSVAGLLGMEGSVGLTTVLIGEVEAADVVQRWGAGSLDVLPAGQIPPNPSELLDSPAMATLLRDLRSHYDVILLDSAPLLPVTDGAVLSRMTDGALVVVGCRTVRRQQLADALTSLDTVDARVLGLVLNQVSAKSSGAAVTYAATPQPAARTWRNPLRRRPRTAGVPVPGGLSAPTPTPRRRGGGKPQPTTWYPTAPPPAPRTDRAPVGHGLAPDGPPATEHDPLIDGGTAPGSADTHHGIRPLPHLPTSGGHTAAR